MSQVAPFRLRLTPRQRELLRTYLWVHADDTYDRGSPAGMVGRLLGSRSRALRRRNPDRTTHLLDRRPHAGHPRPLRPHLSALVNPVHRGRSSVGVFGAFEGAAELLMWDSSSWMVGEFASGYVVLRAVRRSTRPSLKRSTRSMSRLGSLRMWLRGRRRKCSPPRGTVNSSRKRCTARAGATLLRM